MLIESSSDQGNGCRRGLLNAGILHDHIPHTGTLTTRNDDREHLTVTGALRFDVRLNVEIVIGVLVVTVHFCSYVQIFLRYHVLKHHNARRG